MNRFQIASFAAAALLGAAASTAAAADACPLPGALIFEDAAGDQGIRPADAAPVAPPADPVGVVSVPDDNLDLLGLRIAEVGDTIIFTIQVASLEVPIDSGGYIVRFLSDVLPENGDEDYFVAMINTPDATSFVHGTTGAQQDAGTGPRLFNIAGDLEAGSGFTPDGTITLVLKRDTIPGIENGLDLYNILLSVRVLAPTTAAGVTANGSNATLLDQNDGEAGFYTVGGCGKSAAARSSSGVLAAGAFGLPALLGLAGLGALARRRRA